MPRRGVRWFDHLIVAAMQERIIQIARTAGAPSAVLAVAVRAPCPANVHQCLSRQAAGLLDYAPAMSEPSVCSRTGLPYSANIRAMSATSAGAARSRRKRSD